jgi:hypothetical protein
MEVTLDGRPISLPAERRSLGAIRCYLETLALERQRILFTFIVEREPEASTRTSRKKTPCMRVSGGTVDLVDLPVHLLESALHQTAGARESVEAAVALVLINGGPPAREVWWELTRKLKEPLLTLSLLPETLCGPVNGCAPPLQLRKWQLQQLAAVLKDVDRACWSSDALALSNALEHRALPWLDQLRETLSLLRDTVVAGARCRAGRAG